MSGLEGTLDDRILRLLHDLQVAADTLRAARPVNPEGFGKLSRQAIRRLTLQLEKASRTVSELRGALDAYRACALSGRGSTVPADGEADGARHLRDEEVS